MKKLLAVTLILCLTAACAPAMAGSRGLAKAETYTIDMGGGPMTVTGSNSGDSNYDQYLSDYGCLNTTLVMLQMHGIWTCVGSVEGYADYSVDGDETADIRITYEGDESSYSMIFQALPTASCGPVLVQEVPDPCAEENWGPSPFNFDIRYANPLVLILENSAADKTGTYEISADGATFVKPAKKNAASVKIPATITVGGKTFPVIKIADNAFKNNKKLTKVTIGPNIKEIGKNAFANCAKLKTVSGGANVEIIGDSAFSGCKALKGFTIGAKVTRIGKKAFYKCSALRKITIKTRLLTAKTVGSSAFKGIYPAATIKVPKAVKKDYTKWLLKKGVKKTMKIK